MNTMRDSTGVVLLDTQITTSLREDGSITPWHKYGRRDWLAVNQTADVFRPGGVYPVQDSASILTIRADNGNDRVGFDGATSVLVEGVNGDNEAVSEVVALTAQGNNTVNEYQAVNRMAVATAGALRDNSGLITARVGASNIGGPEIAGILAGRSMSHDFIYKVPKGKDLVIRELRSIPERSTSTGVYRMLYRLLVLSPGGVWTVLRHDTVSNAEGKGADMSPQKSLTVPEGYLLKVRATLQGSDIVAAAYGSGYLVDNGNA